MTSPGEARPAGRTLIFEDPTLDSVKYQVTIEDGETTWTRIEVANKALGILHWETI